ncbi:glycoside hydrolase family 16 protein [Cerasicoccus frondis]|uniref:glycoside hydrolase family 16 protein n=1 Tax=Cerasicoccus frondis TaxID=490090 RepID=UPI002852D4CA|nr:glycoside hydrolase family 16 protein [Cerasicoccus frondis]
MLTLTRYPQATPTRVSPHRLFRLLCVALLLAAPALQARDWDTSFADYDVTVKPTDDTVKIDYAQAGVFDGMTLTFDQGKSSYPGVRFLPPEGQTWNFSEFTCIDITLTNEGENAVYVTLRVDNKGDWRQKPWNNESARLAKGDTKNIRVFFGFSARKPGYELDTSNVSAVQLFTGKASEGQKLKIDKLKLSKAPSPYKPNVAPVNSYVLGEGAASIKRTYTGRADASYSGGEGADPLTVHFQEANQAVDIAPADGVMWDFRQGYQLEVSVKNIGRSSINPSAKATSGRGDTDLATLAAPLKPGEEGKLTISFIRAKSMDAGLGRKNEFFESNKAKTITLLSNSDTPQEIEVTSIRLTAPPLKLPDWVGKRPPVEGDWKMTFREEFDADELNSDAWRVYASNFWDKVTRFSKDNVQMHDGKAVLIYEKKAGHHNDDPTHKRYNEYTTGFLDSYGKWVQRYGYFETRMKLPKAPGLWPAFWLMPDRGVEAGPQWKRQDTGNGGMEFDIMEFLSGWGPYRFTTAFHYDGYGKDHKATGSGVYTGHDEEGYITTGLLWLPGLAVVYNNGREVARWETDRISDVESNIIYTFVAGGWDNEPMDNKQLPDEFIIDYVRVWQRADLASDVDGFKSESSASES